MASFYEWGSTASRLEPLQKGRLLFTTKFPEILYINHLKLENLHRQLMNSSCEFAD